MDPSYFSSGGAKEGKSSIKPWLGGEGGLFKILMGGGKGDLFQTLYHLGSGYK